MSSSETLSAAAFSSQLVDLVERSTPALAAVKGAPYRVSSGFAVTSEILATTAHTLKRDERIGIVLPGGRETTATLAGRAPGLDIALLRVEGVLFQPLAEAAEPRVGNLVTVVGFTADVGATASLGMIGAVGGQRRTWRGGTLDRFVRLDVNLYPSQSGAAVVDMDGGLVGLATPALLRHSAVAIPYATLRRIAQEVEREGRLREGYLGVGLQQVFLPENLRQHAGLDIRFGLMILNVEPGSPAESGGLQLGDILVSFGASPTPEPDDLQEALSGDAVGQAREVVLIRGGELVRLSVTAQERPSRRQRG